MLNFYAEAEIKCALCAKKHRILSRLLGQPPFVQNWLDRYGRASKHEASTIGRIMAKLKLSTPDLRP